MKFLTVSFIIIIQCMSGFQHAVCQEQDTIYFMNGDILPCRILDAKDIDVVFEYKKRKRIKSKAVHKSDIFAIVDDGKKTVYYEINQIAGDDLTEKEVELFLAGQRDARSNFDTKIVFITGAAGSFAVSALTGNGLLVKTIPLIVYPVVQMLPRIKIREKTISNPDHRYNLIYADGYERVARGKKIVASIKSSALGSVLGFVFYRLALK